VCEVIDILLTIQHSWLVLTVGLMSYLCHKYYYLKIITFSGSPYHNSIIIYISDVSVTKPVLLTMSTISSQTQKVYE